VLYLLFQSLKAFCFGNFELTVLWVRYEIGGVDFDEHVHWQIVINFIIKSSIEVKHNHILNISLRDCLSYF